MVAQTVKNPPAMPEKLGLIPGLGRSPGEGSGYPRQYSGLENSMDSTVHGVSKSQTGLSNFHFHFLFFLKRSHCKNGESYHHQIRATAPVVFHQEQLWPLGTFGCVDTFGCCSLQDGDGCCAPGI